MSYTIKLINQFLVSESAVVEFFHVTGENVSHPWRVRYKDRELKQFLTIEMFKNKNRAEKAYDKFVRTYGEV